MTLRLLLLVLLAGMAGASGSGPEGSERGTVADTLVLRVAMYNIEDVRTADLRDAEQPRLKKAAAVLQHLRPDILLVNEITYDQPGGPDYEAGAPPGQNARRFFEHFLRVPQADTLEPLRYTPFMAPVNTGLASGFDFNNDGRAVTEIPAVPPPPPDGDVAPQTPEGRAYGSDAWGFGTFPGQYGMALFVREGLDIVEDAVRTFRLLEWNAMPGAQWPVDPETDRMWYGDEERARFRLSSKSHWDVPVRLPNGVVLHVLASHPTPPAFDGPEQRNIRRNYDEIRFWADYLNDAAYIEDDSGRVGGLGEDVPFVIVGDLNADPAEGSALGDPITTWLLSHDRVREDVVPAATGAAARAYPDLDADDTARWGLRVDYVLPSENLVVRGSGVWRPVGPDTVGVAISDHFPVWVDLAVPPGL